MAVTGTLSHLDLSVGDPYGGGYYAVFFADPDGGKLEVVHHHPPTNP